VGGVAVTSYSAAVFDLGGVLIHWDPRLLYRKLLPDEEAVEEFLGTICTPEWNARQDAGRPFRQGIAELVTRFPEHASLIKAWLDRFAEMIRPIEDSVEILRELHRRGVPIYALSNWGAETFDIARDRFGFLQLFNGIVISGRVGVAKPDPRIFRVLLEEHDLSAAEVVFIDDHPPNVETARTLGFDVIHFTTAPELRDGLTQRGLL
jgi:2-haloacid dehalogenase